MRSVECDWCSAVAEQAEGFSPLTVYAGAERGRTVSIVCYAPERVWDICPDCIAKELFRALRKEYETDD